MDDRLVAGLEKLRKKIGAVAINSGFRCPEHNLEEGGEDKSKHLIGLAADTRSLRGLNGHAVAREAESIDVFARGGIGIYSHFTHLDVREDGPARWSGPKKTA